MPNLFGESERVIRVIDFEGTGQDPPEASSIIEVGWCDIIQMQTGWVPCHSWSLMVKPTTPMLIEAMAIHHIRESDVWDGFARDDALRSAAEGPNIVAYAAHGSSYERAMWPEAALPWIDTYKLALKLCPDAPKFSNQVMRYYLGLDLDNRAMPPHRAGPDAFVTAHVLAKLLSMGITFEDAIEVSAKPGLLPRVPIGQQRGQKWSEVDDGFLRWILARDFSEDILFSARTEVNRREAELRSEHPAYAGAETEDDEGMF